MSQLDFNSEIISFQKSLKSFAYSFTANDEDANDLLQDTYLKAIMYKDKFQEKTNLKAWLYTIMRNTFINNYRKAIRANTILDSTDEQYFINVPQKNGFADPVSEFNFKQVESTVESLDNDYKIPFKMYNDGFKYKEIADDLHLPIGTIKSRIFLARKKLMDLLPEYK